MDSRTAAPTGFPQQIETRSMDMLTEFVDQLAAEAEATTASATTAAFPTLDDFDKGVTGALKWRDLVKDRVYQVLSARSIHTQHGTSFVLSLQTADGICYTAWACGILTKELLKNPSMLVDKKRRLYVLPTGLKKSKNGRLYNAYQLLQC